MSIIMTITLPIRFRKRVKEIALSALTILTLLSCTDQIADAPLPRLLSLSFSINDNPMQLMENVNGEIVGDSIVECWVPNIMSSKELIANFAFDGELVTINGNLAESGSTTINYKTPATLIVASGDKARKYTVYVHTNTGLPILWIETDNRAEITSKEIYQRGTFRLVEDIRTRSAGDIIEGSLGIRGRGNSTWEMPKKPYRLKLDAKQPLLDEHEDEDWVLLNNYADKTMLRIQTAFYMGRISNLDYTPHSHFVELMLNGQYNGTYLLCEKLKVSKHRVNVGSDGFLIEIDGRAEGGKHTTFTISHLAQPASIEDPATEADSEGLQYAQDFCNQADSVLYSRHFADPEEGWRKYMDMDSFVDWYLINEITKNNDANMFSSCYMHLKHGGKLKMGPLWDFDIAYGNVDYNDNSYPMGFWVKEAEWFFRMFQDPAFVARVKERFNYFYSRKDDIMREIDENAIYLKYAARENENRWHTFYTYTWPNYTIWGNYNNEIQAMKEWLNARFEWLKTEFDKL